MSVRNVPSVSLDEVLSRAVVLRVESDVVQPKTIKAVMAFAHSQSKDHYGPDVLDILGAYPLSRMVDDSQDLSVSFDSSCDVIVHFQSTDDRRQPTWSQMSIVPNRESIVLSHRLSRILEDVGVSKKRFIQELFADGGEVEQAVRIHLFRRRPVLVEIDDE